MTENSDKKYTVYKITCLKNGKVYIGATSKTVEQRLAEHWSDRSDLKNEHRFVSQDMSVFGRDSFVIETIETNLSQEEAALRENYYIEKFRADGYSLYNKIGGGGNIQLTEKQEMEIIRLHEDGLDTVEIAKLVKRNRRTISAVLNRNGIETCGITSPKEVLCVESGVVYESAREAARQLGLCQAHISACCSGKLKSTGGLHFCFEKDKDNFVIPERKTDPTPKEVLCVETGMVYLSIGEAARQLGVDRRHVSDCCLGRRKSTGGLHFRFVESNCIIKNEGD